MPLNFDVADVADNETLCWGKDQWGHADLVPVSKALVFYTMRVGMNEITEANADEFAERVIAVEEREGANVYLFEEETGFTMRPITVEDVRAHVGLRTNASRLSKAAFRKTLSKAA